MKLQEPDPSAIARIAFKLERDPRFDIVTIRHPNAAMWGRAPAPERDLQGRPAYWRLLRWILGMCAGITKPEPNLSRKIHNFAEAVIRLEEREESSS